MLPTNHDLLDPSARLVAEAVTQLGWNANPQALAERIRQLLQGLPAEDEFTLLLSWLGRCSVIHRLDQKQVPPGSKSKYRVPDLLAVFRYGDREIPALIEVKTSAGRTLSWRPDYFESLRDYAQLLGLPLLVAWKWTKLGIWILCDLLLFERGVKNYRLTHLTAAQHSLMSKLAGDFAFVLRPGVGLHLKLEKIEIVASLPPATTWLLRVEDAFFTDATGTRLNTLGRGCWWMFLGVEPDEDTDDHPGHINQSFVVTMNSPMQFAQCLLASVSGGWDADQPVPWRLLMERHTFTIDGASLMEEAIAAIDRNIVAYVFHQEPAALPVFLKE